ncbi:unnamed protein product [Adineta ricciae]|uniref:Uncharacterized protein n=1 Tax=Adineta ricciae TaxID=249248 RepID=A0A813NXK6_ADIRI|nr:unnamed protein product [Adineta ricciae]CAF0744017.1 unnamed protein product [Adineta ricciae]
MTGDYHSINKTHDIVRILKLNKTFHIDDASVIVSDFNGTFRLPKDDPAYDQPFNRYWPRDDRELETERFMLNVHGTFYEAGREAGYVGIRPIATHSKKIMDFASWRGIVILTGTKQNASFDGHYFPTSRGNDQWFGMIEDLWKLGKPRGEGALWKENYVNTNEISLTYLMTGYDKKTVSITADTNINVTLQVNVELHGWHNYKPMQAIAGSTIHYVFSDGYSDHWIRAVVERACTITISFKYQ